MGNGCRATWVICNAHQHKLFTGKKEEIVKKVLAVEGFEYAGKIPVNLTWSSKS